MDSQTPQNFGSNPSVIPFPQRDASTNRPLSRERLTPQSLESEQNTLGACLLDRDAVARAVGLITVGDFYRELHNKIFRVILKLFDRGEPVDIVTVAKDLRRAGQLEECGGIDYLSSLAESCPSSADVEAYAKVVHEKSVLRQLIRAGEQICSWAYQPDTDEVTTLVDRAEKKIFEIGQKQLRDGLGHIKPLLESAYDHIERHFQHKGDMVGIPTGFYDLDDLTSGLQPSDLIVVGGRLSIGKTALALNIAHHIALKERRPVAIFSLEMSKEQLVQRLICSQAEIRSQDLRRGRVQDSDWHRITNAVNELHQAPIFIDDALGTGTFEIGAKARRLTAEYGQLGLVVVDYLQLVRSPGKSEDRFEETSQIAHDLKSMARELKCPVMGLSQLPRTVEQHQDRRPLLSDLESLGTLGEDADVVLFVFRASYYRRKMMRRDGTLDPNAEPDPDEGIAEIIIGKQRNGPVGMIKLGFQPEFARFTNLARDANRSYDD